jgi:hypothetical protein
MKLDTAEAKILAKIKEGIKAFAVPPLGGKGKFHHAFSS